MSETTAIEKPAKPGWKTSEFALTTITMLMGQLFASGLLVDGGTAFKIATFAASLLAVAGYTVARTKAKA